MKLELADAMGNKFFFEFKHDFVESSHANPNKRIQVERTRCFIYEEADADKERPLVAVGAAVRNNRDRYVPAAARKAAFTHAISGFPEETRTRFWNQYLRQVNVVSGGKIMKAGTIRREENGSAA